MNPVPKKITPASRKWFFAAAAVVFLASVLFPTHWYEILRRPADAPPRPFDGTTLLRLTFLLEAIVFAAIGGTRWRPQSRPHDDGPLHGNADNDISQRTAVLLVVLITIVAATLRFYRLGADLWIDEIATVESYAARPLLEIFGSYLSPGNHLLNSLLVRISYSIFGISEASVRLPAVLFGIATIPAMYYAARMAMSRAASVAAALILAVSYHHIFYSQDSKGYAGYLFFVLVASALLANLLERDSTWKWIAYVIATALAFASLMTAAFALGAHIIVGALALIAVRRQGLPITPLAQRLVAALATAGFVAFQIYALSVPDVIAIYPTVYNVQGSGYFFFSADFVREMARGITAGFGGPLILVPILAVGAAGFVIFMKRSWALATSLFLTVFLTIAFLLLRGQSVAPRMLLPAVPLAVLSCMATIEMLLVQPRRALAAGILISALSLALLPSYYTAPKQPWRAAIAFLESEHRDRAVIVPYPAARGFRYYVTRTGLSDSARYHYVFTPGQYDSALADPRQKVLATTLFRVLREADPITADRIEKEWDPARTVRGTLGDGNIVIWTPKATATPR